MDIVEKFVHLHIDYIEVVLSPAVSRASHADHELSGNAALQKQLRQTTFGLCVIYHMAFVQSALGDNWNGLKRFDSADREGFNIDWCMFDTIKYIRDCFAHDPDGELFPSEQNNTSRFLSNIDNYPDLKVDVIDNKLAISSSTVQQSFNFFESMLREIIT